MGFGQSLPLTVMTFDLLYCSTSCCKTRTINTLQQHVSVEHVHRCCITSTGSYRRPPGDVRVLLVEVLLELGELVQVPVFLPKPVSGVAELSAATTAAAAAVPTEARRSSAIAAIKSRFTASERTRTSRGPRREEKRPREASVA